MTTDRRDQPEMPGPDPASAPEPASPGPVSAPIESTSAPEPASPPASPDRAGLSAPEPASPPAAPGGTGGKALTSRARRRLRILAFGVIPGLFCVVLIVGLIRTNKPTAVAGKLAPTFANLPLLGGGTLSSASLQGKPLVVNFFASWCEPCQQEAPTLESLYKQYRAQGVQVIGVDYEDLDSDAEAFIKQNGTSYPILRDPDGMLATQFGVRGVPETYFIDGQYRFVSIGAGQQEGSQGGTRILGAVSKPEMISQINELLSFNASPSP
ncbi:MAG: TlpA disulfide reductase family protein [Actinomycetota bacterium]